MFVNLLFGITSNDFRTFSVQFLRVLPFNYVKMALKCKFVKKFFKFKTFISDEKFQLFTLIFLP